MKPFEYAMLRNLAEAAGALNSGAACSSGGIDLLDRMKEGIDSPKRLVTLAGAIDDAIAATDDGSLRIGARATLAQIAASAVVRRAFPALASAAAHAATPQVRNQATIAGNILQRSRCLYYRLAAAPCRKKGASDCPAIAGHHHYAGVYATDLCPAVHPSNLAVPLTAANAQLEIYKSGATRRVGIAEIFVGPEEDATREHRLNADEIVTAIFVPAGSEQSAYLEARERQGADWALAAAACVLRIEDAKVASALVVTGFVAPTPRRESAVEAALVGVTVDQKSARHAAAQGLADAKPLPGTRYKIPMTRALIARAIIAAAAEAKR